MLTRQLLGGGRASDQGVVVIGQGEAGVLELHLSFSNRKFKFREERGEGEGGWFAREVGETPNLPLAPTRIAPFSPK